MVELKETNEVLKHASDRSLVILDELGRGTSTFDGYSIAFSVLNYLTNRKYISMFSTHYHMLTEEFRNNKKVSLKMMQCFVDETYGTRFN